MNKNVHLILFPLLLSFWACDPAKPKEEKTFIYELPKPRGADSLHFYYRYKNMVSEQLSLTRLEDGVDSFELRLWSEITIAQPSILYTLKKAENNWQCMQYNIWGHDESLNNFKFYRYIVDSVQLYSVKPKCDWNMLLDSMNKEGLLTLPSNDEIKGMENVGISDGTIYSVEYATSSKYRFYYYHSPSVLPQFSDCVKMNNILEMWARNVGGIFWRPMREKKPD
ncbi:hypothetical protein QQ054_28290 [Oscillatoria amoena NRMC-F 0135]|nr:hypothetical protein [Oscillatoria amoena NRMC-F 0135]